jgi:hypothetical protein
MSKNAFRVMATYLVEDLGRAREIVYVLDGDNVKEGELSPLFVFVSTQSEMYDARRRTAGAVWAVGIAIGRVCVSPEVSQLAILQFVARPRRVVTVASVVDALQRVTICVSMQSSPLNKTLRRHPALFGVPFILLIVAASFGLSSFTQTRYDLHNQKVSAVRIHFLHTLHRNRLICCRLFRSQSRRN